MGLAGARNAAVSGLQAQSSRISISSDNIANAATVGYKALRGVFSTLVTDSGTSIGYSSGGVNMFAQNLIEQQGLIESTGRVTDIAISGSGFFSVQDASGELVLTRQGAFDINNKGEMVNASGFKLLGWPLDSDGLKPGETGNTNTTASESVDSLEIVDTNAASGTATATTTVTIGANLNAGQAKFQGATVTIDFKSSINNLNQSQIIAPSDIGSSAGLIQPGDGFSFNSSGLTSTFTYGGFAVSEDIDDVTDAGNTVFGATSIDDIFQTSTAGLQNGDQFTIATTSSGTVTFTFTSATPDTAQGQFNSFSTLAQAIDAVNGLTGRISGGQLYVSSTDANESITFSDVSGRSLPTSLGFSSTTSGTDRFNTLQGLAAMINSSNVTQISARVINPTANSTLEIFASDPLQDLTLSKLANQLLIDPLTARNGGGTLNENQLIIPAGTMAKGDVLVLGTAHDSAADGTFTYGGFAGSKKITTTATAFGVGTLTDTITSGAAGAPTTGDVFTFSDGSNSVSVTFGATAGTQWDTVEELATLVNADVNFRARAQDGKLYISSINSNFGLTVESPVANVMTTSEFVLQLGGDFDNNDAATSLLPATTDGKQTILTASAGVVDSVDFTVASPFGAADFTTDFAGGGLVAGTDTIIVTVGGVSTTLTFDVATVASDGIFQDAESLVQELDNIAGVSAWLADDKIYARATSSTASFSIASGAGVGDIAGILDIDDVVTTIDAVATQRFNTLAQLSTQIDADAEFDATLTTGTNATIAISGVGAADELEVLAASSNALVKELGLREGRVGDTFIEEFGLQSILADADTSAVVDQSYNSVDTNKNLAGGKVSAHFSRNIRLFDGLGTGHDFRIAFLKIGVNQWATEVYPLTSGEVNAAAGGSVASGVIEFNGDGSLKSVASALAAPITLNWTTGASPTTVSFNWGTAGQPSGTSGATVIGLTDGLRQFDAANSIDFVEQNGVAAGQFSGIEVSEDGIVSAKFSNGEIKSIYKIPILTVQNPNALAAKTGNVWEITQASGEATLRDAGIGGAGVIVAGALEGSTADIAEELTQTIGTQANYNANATLISTIKDMEEELNRRL